MTEILTDTIYFYYIAIAFMMVAMVVSFCISQLYLFVVAVNVGFLKRFAGL